MAGDEGSQYVYSLQTSEQLTLDASVALYAIGWELNWWLLHTNMVLFDLSQQLLFDLPPKLLLIQSTEVLLWQKCRQQAGVKVFDEPMVWLNCCMPCFTWCCTGRCLCRLTPP
jgi:hypothetical protein